MNTKTLICISAIALFGICVTACDPNNPDKQQPEEITISAEGCLKTMLRYFPYQADQTLVFVRDKDNREWHISPSLEGNPSRTFPIVHTEKWTEKYPEWENIITAPFMVDGLGNVYITKLMMDLFTMGNKGFQFHLMAQIRLKMGEYYNGSLDIDLDSVALKTFFTDTIMVPFSQFLYDNSIESKPVPDGAQMHFVKDKGLVDFSVDGISVWRRVE